MEQNDARTRVGLAIKQDLLSRGINTKMAAEKLGVSPAGVSVYFSGRKFSQKAAEKWAKTFDLDKTFLMSGTGRPSNYVTMSLSPEEKNLILALRKKGNKKLSTRSLDAIRLEQSISEINAAVDNLNLLFSLSRPVKR